MSVNILDNSIGVQTGAPSGSPTISNGSQRVAVLPLQFTISGAETFLNFMRMGGVDYTLGKISRGTLSENEYNWVFTWDEAAIASMVGTAISISQTRTPSNQHWDFTTYQNVSGGHDFAPTVNDPEQNTSDMDYASDAEDMKHFVVARKAANRDITDFDDFPSSGGQPDNGWQTNESGKTTFAQGYGVGGQQITTYVGDGISGNGFWLSDMLMLRGEAGVNLPPVVDTQIPDQVCTIGVFFSYDASQHFSDPNNDNLTHTQVGLPNGLTINAAGLISGTPSGGFQ